VTLSFSSLISISAIHLEDMERNSEKDTSNAQICEPDRGVGTSEIYIDPIKESRMMRKFDVRKNQIPWQTFTDRSCSSSLLDCWDCFT
jgi:hypothetical protein